MRKPLAVLIVLLSCAAGAHAEVLFECHMTNQNFEWLDRAFYVPAFPADRLDGVELQFGVLVPRTYTFRLTARAGTYDGPVIGESTAGFRDSDWIPLESGEATGPDGAPLGGISLASGGFDFGGAPVEEGTTVTFVLEELATDLPTLYDMGPCGQGDATCDLCGFEVIQTEGATPPLDTFWRASVGVLVTGPTNAVPASTPAAAALLALLLTMLAARRIRPGQEIRRLFRFGQSLVIVFGLILATPAGARSPWLQEKNEGFFQLSTYRIDTYDRLYRNSGDDFRLNREITDTTIEAYVEYGLTEQWTLVGVAPFKALEAGKEVPSPTLQPTIIEAGTESMFGNLKVGARRRFKDAAYALSGQVDLELPTGGLDRATGLTSAYDAVTVTPTVGLGKRFSRAYVHGYFGLGLRSNDFSSDWRTGLEIGGKFFDRVWLIGLADVVQSFKNGDVELDPENLQTGLYVNDQEYTAYAAKILIDLTRRVGLQATRYSATGGNNVARQALTGLGLYFKW